MELSFGCVGFETVIRSSDADHLEMGRGKRIKNII